MGERTADERATFGKVKTGECGAPLELNESNIDWLIEQYKDESFRLLSDCAERGRDKFAREFSKLEASGEQQVFFTEKGVENRHQRLKFKTL